MDGAVAGDKGQNSEMGGGVCRPEQEGPLGVGKTWVLSKQL